jgi:hypothetical protein
MNKTAARHANMLRTKRRMEILLKWGALKYIALTLPGKRKTVAGEA